MVKLALIAASRQPALYDCTRNSIMDAVVKASELGLDMSGTLGSAYLVPLQNRKTRTLEAHLWIGYRGLIDLARRSGQISAIHAAVVYPEDEFEYELGDSPKLRHVPDLDGPCDDSKARFVYAVGLLRDGTKQIEVMSRKQVEKIRNAAASKDSGAWQQHWGEMARKTVIRRLCKYLPMSTELAEAIAYEDDRDEQYTPAPRRTRGKLGAEGIVERIAPPDEPPVVDAEPSTELPDTVVGCRETVWDSIRNANPGITADALSERYGDICSQIGEGKPDEQLTNAEWQAVLVEAGKTF